LSSERPLPAIRLDIGRAKKRLTQLRAEEYRLLVRVPCRLCGAAVGKPCTKGTTQRVTAAHAERHRDSTHAL
jgi:hypothetical protein